MGSGAFFNVVFFLRPAFWYFLGATSKGLNLDHQMSNEIDQDKIRYNM